MTDPDFDHPGKDPVLIQSVEEALDTLRPYLMADGGSVRLLEITPEMARNFERIFNVRFNYIYRPGDDLFIVYNEGRDYNNLTRGLMNRTLLVKFTHSFDF